MKRFVVVEKKVGETPLECMENWRATASSAYQNLPLAYAGRLDPMASGKLLILIGDECKRQSEYHNLDKAYRFEVLFGVHSDTGDVLGLIKSSIKPIPTLPRAALGRKLCKKLEGKIELPYPHFSSKTVAGKPLHVWTLEDRLSEIEIPTKQSTIYKLRLANLRTETKDSVYRYATEKIETIPPVTDPRKALGNDFRRPSVRAAWKTFLESSDTPDSFTIATFDCITSSGTYMRTLAEVIARELGTTGLAYSIRRTHIGTYQPLPFGLGFWRKLYQ